MSFTYIEKESNNQAQVNIKVIGIGGGGNNTVAKMTSLNVEGVELIAANTDMQILNRLAVEKKLQLGAKITNGMGAGSDVEVGRLAAEESEEAIKLCLENADIVFIAAGLGGGTGTGASPVVARIARELGALTIAIVTKPFVHEGRQRTRVAEKGVKVLKDEVDCLIIIPNEQAFKVMGSGNVVDAFNQIDDVLASSVQSISNIIQRIGIINTDLNDFRNAMKKRGIAMISSGEESGENRAQKAAELALSSPLLENIKIERAQGLLINICCDKNTLNVEEYNTVNNIIYQLINDDDEKMFIKHGLTDDPTMGDRIRVTIFATGITEDDDVSSDSKNPFNFPSDFGDKSGIPGYLR